MVHQNITKSQAVIALQATGGLSGASLDSIVASLDALQEAMKDWGVPPPAEGWKAWCAGYQNATKDARAAFEVEGVSLVQILWCYPGSAW